MTRVQLTNAAAIVCIALLAASAVAFHIAIDGVFLRKLPINPPDGMRFPTMPAETESWERFGADPPPLSAEILESLGTRNYFSRNYIRKDTIGSVQPLVLDLHCAYYTGMPDTVPHIPEKCFVGGGMTLVSEAVTVRVPLDLERFPPDPTIDPAIVDPEEYGVVRRARTGPHSDAPGLRVRLPFGADDLKLRITEYQAPNGARLFAGYFFIANGWAVSDGTQVRAQAFDLSADYAFYAKVQFTSGAVKSAEELAAAAGSLLNEMMPEIMRRVPDWTEVIAGRYPPPDDVAEANTRAIRGSEEYEQWKEEFVPPDLPGRR